MQAEAQTADAPIALAAGHQTGAYAQVFKRAGRIHIPNILRTADATRVNEALRLRTPWNLTIVHGHEVVYDLTPQQLAEMSDAQKQAFTEEVNQAAGRQYEARYRTHRVSDHGETYAGVVPELTALSKFLNGPAFLDLVRAISGLRDIEFADAQATCFEPGDFLHPHFDDMREKKRLVAYVLNLTPRWKVEWGGLLGFIGDDNHLLEAYTPAWNALNLLDVTRLHYVSNVAQFAPEKRYSITGWLRAR